MSYARILMGTALALALGSACSSDDGGGPVVVGGGDGGAPTGDGGMVWGDGGNVIGNPPPPGVVDPGSINAAGTFKKDETGAAGQPATVIDPLRTAAAGAGAGSAGGGGGSATPSNCAPSGLVYPYDATVMPWGLASPPFMFSQPYDVAYVRVGYQANSKVDYEFAAAAGGELRIPDQAWAEIIARTEGGSPLTFTFATQRGGAVSACTTRLNIAGGTMKGALYYNTYNHPQSGGLGAIVRLTLGQPQSELYLNFGAGVLPTGPCISCHSLSADGRKMAASQHLYGPFGAATFEAQSYDVTDNSQPPRGPLVGDATFGALYPDGRFLLQMGNPECTANADTFPRAPNNFQLAAGPTSAGLLDTQNGQSLNAQGLNNDWYMWMPQFSPDGRKVVFNHAKPDGSGGTDRFELAMMDFNVATNTFSNLKVLLSKADNTARPTLPYSPGDTFIGGSFLSGGPITGTNGCNQALSDQRRRGQLPTGSCEGPCYPAWPFFTPDGRGVIYSMTSEPDFAVAFPGRTAPAKSELWYVDTQTGARVRLDKANAGLDPADALTNYYPTVLPIPVGGTFWMFWTTTRKFGTRSTEAPFGASIAGESFYGPTAKDAFRKRIWLAAIQPQGTGEFGGGPLVDPSSPGFYLEGQGDTGNIRAFAALNPCKQQSDTCESGFDCCTGYCDQTTHLCAPFPTCGEKGDRCSTTADCCNPPKDGGSPLECLGLVCDRVILK